MVDLEELIEEIKKSRKLLSTEGIKNFEPKIGSTFNGRLVPVENESERKDLESSYVVCDLASLNWIVLINLMELSDKLKLEDNQLYRLQIINIPDKRYKLGATEYKILECKLLAHNPSVKRVDYKEKKIEPDDIPENERQRVGRLKIGLTLDGKVEFFGGEREANGSLLKSDPGFYLWDKDGNSYKCYIKRIDPTEIGKKYKLIVTNRRGHLVYLEPQLIVDDEIYVKIKNKTKRGDYGFRFFSYDGFVSTKKDFFELNDLKGLENIQIGHYYRVKISYDRRDPSIDKKNHIVDRVGFVKGIALKEVPEEVYKHNQEKIFRAGSTAQQPSPSPTPK